MNSRLSKQRELFNLEFVYTRTLKHLNFFGKQFTCNKIVEDTTDRDRTLTVIVVCFNEQIVNKKMDDIEIQMIKQVAIITVICERWFLLKVVRKPSVNNHSELFYYTINSQLNH